jgi:hypothetical protein
MYLVTSSDTVKHVRLFKTVNTLQLISEVYKFTIKYRFHWEFLIVTYHSRFVPERVPEASKIFLARQLFYQNDIAMVNNADVTGNKFIVLAV